MKCPRCQSPLTADQGYGGGASACAVCGFEVDGPVLESVQEFSSSGQPMGARSYAEHSRPVRSQGYDLAIAQERYKSRAFEELGRVARALRMEQHEEAMKAYLIRVVADEWGSGWWLTIWCAAVGCIVARTRQEPLPLSISNVARAVGIEMGKLCEEYRVVCGLLRVRQQLEAGGVSAVGVSKLASPTAYNGPPFAALAAMGKQQLAAVGTPSSDIPKVLHAMAAELAPSKKFPLPNNTFDIHSYIGLHVRKLLPADWFGDTVLGNSNVNCTCHSCTHTSLNTAGCDGRCVGFRKLRTHYSIWLKPHH